VAEVEAREEVEEAAERRLLERAGGREPIGEDLSSGWANGWLSKDLTYHNWDMATPDERRKVKDDLVSTLAQRSGIDYKNVNEFIKQWAYSSNDDDMRSLAIQKAASELFGVPLSEFTQGKVAGLEKQLSELRARGVEPEYIREFKPKFASLLPDTQQKAILQSMYDYTQEQFKREGWKEGGTIRLRRGMTLPSDIAGDWKAGDVITVKGNTLESWSVGKDIARRFGDIVLEMDVPIEAIVSTARTGFGCLTEGEFIVLGSLPGEAKVSEIYK